MTDQTNKLGKYFLFFEKVLIPIFFIYQACISYKSVNFASFYTIASSFADFAKLILLASLLIFSNSHQRILNARSLIGIILSYGALLFTDVTVLKSSNLFSVLSYSAIVFYSFIIVLGLLGLGKSFTISPAYTALKTDSLFKIVRHPLYSSYIHLFVTFILLNFTTKNVVALLLLFIGLLLRSLEEEKLLEQKTGKYFTEFTKVNRFFSPVLTLPVILLFILFLFETKYKKHSSIVYIDYPIYSLNPHKADDWSSFFVINHIYPRFNESHGEFRGRSVLESKTVSCEDKSTVLMSKTCKRVKVDFSIIKGFKSCNGQNYNSENFKLELSEITKQKNWIFPNFKWCKKSKNCFVFDNVDNIADRFNSIYLRFGWSLNKLSTSHGIHPTCFNSVSIKNNSITEGIIITPKKEIVLTTTNKASDIFLYGNANFSTNVSKLNFYNPIYYFLVISQQGKKTASNQQLEIYTSALSKVFANHNVITSEIPESVNLDSQPHNEAAFIKDIRRSIVTIPDFLENCIDISNDLKRIDSPIPFDFKCENITEFVEDKVKIANGKWEAYISPLTPGMPGKNALNIQYFSITSSDSWLGKNDPKNTFYRLIGSAKGMISVKKGTYCSINPNSLGLSDINIDDFIKCP
jgi:protein-S-isoprenylcysteine O-methyltransferase Ste14